MCRRVEVTDVISFEADSYNPKVCGILIWQSMGYRKSGEFK